MELVFGSIDDCRDIDPKYEFCADPDSWKKDISYHEHDKEKENFEEQDSSLENEFNRLSELWKSVAAGPQSSVSRIVTHPAYLEIISKGEKMIPFILRDLQKEPNHWFIALKILAKQFSPVKPEDAGNIKKMTEAWLE